MVDCRAGGAGGADMPHAPNGNEHQVNQYVGNGCVSVGQQAQSGDMALALASPPGVPGAPGAPVVPPPPHTYAGVPMAPYGYNCGVKSVVWCASPPAPAPPPPPPPPVNPHVYKSVQPNGSDLPMNDIPTLRYYFNLGVECMWAAYGPPPRHYSPRDLAQDMQQISLHERPPAHDKHKDNKPPPHSHNNKGPQQRPLLGPRFKRNNQEGPGGQGQGGQGGHPGKPHNNMPGKGPNHNHNNHNNHRYNRNSHADGRGPGGPGVSPGAPGGPGAPLVVGAPGAPGAPGGYEECASPPLLSVPYMHYPPPVYQLPYYPTDEPAMIGMMGGMGYVNYEEGVEYALPYYPQPYPLLPPPMPPHIEHK